jgi:hypothetical protein
MASRRVDLAAFIAIKATSAPRSPTSIGNADMRGEAHIHLAGA